MNYLSHFAKAVKPYPNELVAISIASNVCSKVPFNSSSAPLTMPLPIPLSPLS
jgi:hypothetical protein